LSLPEFKDDYQKPEYFEAEFVQDTDTRQNHKLSAVR